MLDRDTAIHLVAGGWVFPFISSFATPWNPVIFVFAEQEVGTRIVNDDAGCFDMQTPSLFHRGMHVTRVSLCVMAL